MHCESPDSSGAPRRAPPNPSVFIWIFGILLPIAAILVEATTGLCRGTFFDPLPTPFHVALFATIPIANLRMVFALRDQTPLSRPWAWLHAFSFGVAIVYSLVFLPITPIALLGIFAFGLGVLGLAPLCAVVCAIRGRRALKAMSGDAAPVLGFGIALAVAMLVAIDLPSTITGIGVRMATDAAPETRARGIGMLRAVGSEEALLRLSYGRTSSGTDLLGFLLSAGGATDSERARTLFYQVTGEAFNSRPPPVRLDAGYRIDDMFEFDEERGGEAVGGRVRDVALVASRIDGSIDANAALGYMEWTMEFHNASRGVQEGRAELALPPGAVVSRATLWIDGEEREAAFGGRSQVRAAYEKVVKQSRDPLLVTTAGADRVLVQVFPIPAGGDMKIRIGITAPMSADGPNGPRLPLPSFSERNFELGSQLRHAVWFESATPLRGSAGLKSEAVPGGLWAVRGQLGEPLPGQPAHAVEAPGVRPAAQVWSMDDKNKDGKVIVQTRATAPAVVPRRVALVIDGSVGMRAAKGELATALAAFPQEVELALVFAGDARPSLYRHQRNDALSMRRWLDDLDFEGGRDNGPALGVAWDWARQAEGAVVWLHGTQPVVVAPLEDMQQRFERRAGQVALYDMALVAGPNVVAQKLDGLDGMTRVARIGTVSDDLRRLFAQWRPGATGVVVTRERRAPGAIAAVAKTSPHLARLWAAGQVAALSRDPSKGADAVALASRYQLVTPVSGAVVLETSADYEAAGLEPVAPGSVPTIPEPETWALIIVSLLALLWRRKYQHQRQMRAA